MAKYYKVVLDTNILLSQIELGIDIKSEIQRIIPGRYSIVVLEPIATELEKKIGSLGHKLLNELNAKIVKIDERFADDAIVKFAAENKDAVIATNDRELIKKLTDLKTPVIYIRGKQKLEVKGYLG